MQLIMKISEIKVTTFRSNRDLLIILFCFYKAIAKLNWSQPSPSSWLRSVCVQY